MKAVYAAAALTAAATISEWQISDYLAWSPAAACLAMGWLALRLAARRRQARSTPAVAAVSGEAAATPGPRDGATTPLALARRRRAPPEFWAPSPSQAATSRRRAPRRIAAAKRRERRAGLGRGAAAMTF